LCDAHKPVAIVTRKIPVERIGKFYCPQNRYFSQITLTNRIYLFNSAVYITASKIAACKQVREFEIKLEMLFRNH
jgi:hypothetical protein